MIASRADEQIGSSGWRPDVRPRRSTTPAPSSASARPQAARRTGSCGPRPADWSRCPRWVGSRTSTRRVGPGRSPASRSIRSHFTRCCGRRHPRLPTDSVSLYRRAGGPDMRITLVTAGVLGLILMAGDFGPGVGPGVGAVPGPRRFSRVLDGRGRPLTAATRGAVSSCAPTARSARGPRHPASSLRQHGSRLCQLSMTARSSVEL